MRLFYIPFVLLVAACAAPTTPTGGSSTPTFATWVFADEKPDGEEVRRRYLEGAFAMAEAAGMEQLQGFTAGKQLMGELTPEFVGIYTWPDAGAARAMRESETYTREYKALRPLGWDELVAVDVELPTLPNWDFKPGRYYTIALVWTKSEAAYQRYVQATAGLRAKMDFSILFSEPVVSWSHLGLDPALRAPDRVALLDWPDERTPDRYLKAISDDEFAEIVEATFEGVYWHEVHPR